MTPLELYAEIAKPYLQLFPANSCIEQTRIAVECLSRSGVLAEPIEAKIVVTCEKCECVFISGATAEERERGKREAKTWIERPHHPRDEHGKHVVALARDNSKHYVVDSTLAQASQPNLGFVLPREVVAIGPLDSKPVPGDVMEVNLVTDEGLPFSIRYFFSDTKTYLDTPAWEPSHLWPLIHHIVWEMEQALTDL